MMIPKLHYISQGKTPKEHLTNIQSACTSGAELVQLNLQGISDKKNLKFAAEAREITAHFQTRLLINQYYKIAKQVKADGVHLKNSETCPLLVRKHLFTWQIIGADANTLQDCEKLLQKQIDYISLGPFKSTLKNTNTPLGLNGYSLILEALQTTTPIIGVGGITTEDISDILGTGISGVAVSDAITQNFNSITTFHRLLKASSTVEKRHQF